MKRSILIVDDEPGLADTLAIIFKRAGYAANAVYNCADAIASIENGEPSLVITDVIMPGMSGVELARTIRARYPLCRVLLFSGNADAQYLLDASQEQGDVFEVLAKPVPPLQSLSKVAELLSA
jgi:DNA-binding NtrC family response regulator